LLLGMPLGVFAAGGTVTLTNIAGTFSKTILNIVSLLTDVALIAGIGFILASFFKFDQHKKNPTQIPMSQPLTLLMIGAALCVFPMLISTVRVAIFGKSATQGKLGNTQIKTLIGTGK